MHVQHLDPEKFVQAYNVDLQSLYPWEGVVEPPFGAAWAILSAGESTKVHQHQEGETFFIVRGAGTMTVDGESTPVRPGSVIFQRPFHQHVLTNTSDTEDLMFLALWWEDKKLWARDATTQKTTAAPSTTAVQRVMVTAAPPTPNGDLHVGHLSGPYLAADVYTRYLRLRGVEGYYACGSDDHCMYVERMGEKLGMSGPEAADHFVAEIEQTLKAAGISMHLFLRPDASPRFEPLVLAMFNRLWHDGKLESRDGPSPYCEICQRYLFEADICGHCPHCGDGVTGNTCETCGGVNDCLDIVDARCSACDTPPATRTFRRLFFPLSRYADALTKFHRGATMSARLRSFCERQIAAGLPDVAISHISDWGIRVPFTMENAEGSDESESPFSNQTLYVWFEMAARYLAYAGHLNDIANTEGDGAHDEEESYRSFWSSDEARIVQFFGFDNSFYYALMLPALYLAFDETLRLPAAFVVNEFYRLDGDKFSTSRGHSIPGRELLAAAPRDMVRFYLAYSGPEREQSNFTRAEFEDTVERELVRGFKPWLIELAQKVATEFAGVVPATGDWTDEHLHFYRQLEMMTAEAAEAYEPETFSLQRLSRVLIELVRTARRFGKSEMHWRDIEERQQERRTGVALELLAARVLAVLAAPVMPDFAGRLWRDLGYQEPLSDGAWELSPSWIPAGQHIGDLGAHDFPNIPAFNANKCLTQEPVPA